MNIMICLFFTHDLIIKRGGEFVATLYCSIDTINDSL